MSKAINWELLREMFNSGAEAIKKESKYIDELNVFPVPDGDTGTNLKITISNAVAAIYQTNEINLHLLTKNFAKNLLMNARGNSGVIFSQIFKGFSLEINENVKEINIDLLKKCFLKASEKAYESVVEPIEGTMLTVIRETATNINNKKCNSINEFFDFLCILAQESLKKTPEKLAQLKHAGVVDSGGYGLCCFLNGMRECVSKNKVLTLIKNNKTISINQNPKTTEEGFGYCTEFIFVLKAKVDPQQREKKDFNLKKFKNSLLKIGSSLVVVEEKPHIKVHIHTNEPHKALEKALDYGETINIKIENMTHQFLLKNPGSTLDEVYNLKQQNKEERLSNKTKILVFCDSQNLPLLLKNEFKINNAFNIGYGNLPSTSSFFNEIKNQKSTNILILIDNKNCIPSLQKTIDVLPKKINVKYIEAFSLASIYKFATVCDNDLNMKNNMDRLTTTIKNMQTITITKAIKNSEIIKGIKRGDFVSFINKNPFAKNANLFNLVKQAINKVNNNNNNNIYCTYNFNVSKDEINNIKKYITEVCGKTISFISVDQKKYILSFVF